MTPCLLHRPSRWPRPPIYAVITTHQRHQLLTQAVAAVADDVHHVIVVDNASTPPVPRWAADTVIHDPEQPPNLSRLWNVGLETAANHAAMNMADTWDVLVLNDDVVCGPGVPGALQQALRTTGVDAASPGPFDVEFHEPGPIALPTRMAGYCWMVRGESGLRADEALRWWYGDDDIGQQACAGRGRLVVPGLSLHHLHPDESTRTRPVLAEQAIRDRTTFVSKWGFEPW